MPGCLAGDKQPPVGEGVAGPISRRCLYGIPITLLVGSRARVSISIVWCVVGADDVSIAPSDVSSVADEERPSARYARCFTGYARCLHVLGHSELSLTSLFSASPVSRFWSSSPPISRDNGSLIRKCRRSHLLPLLLRLPPAPTRLRRLLPCQLPFLVFFFFCRHRLCV